MQFGPGVRVPSLRAAHYFNAIAKIYPYAGLEVAYATYKTKTTSARGSIEAAYLGGEYYLNDRFAFGFDFGVSYISLGEAKYKYTVTGTDFVTNFGLTYYFGGK